MMSLKSNLLFIRKVLVNLILIILVGELIARAIYFNRWPFLPLVQKDRLMKLPENETFIVENSNGIPIEYITNNFSARVNKKNLNSCNSCLLVVGDSQAMGWGQHFKDSFFYNKEFDNIISVSGPLLDIEKNLFELKSLQESKVKLNSKENIVVINLGNDLDELFWGRYSYHNYSDTVLEFLLMNSKLYSALSFYKNKALSSFSPISKYIYTLNDYEYHELVESMIKKYLDLVDIISGKNNTTLVILPSDISFGVNLDSYGDFTFDNSYIEKLEKREMYLENLFRMKLKMNKMNLLILRDYKNYISKNNLQIFNVGSHHLSKEGHSLIKKILRGGLR